MHSAAVFSLHVCGQFLGKPGNLMPEPAPDLHRPSSQLHSLGLGLADCPVYLCVGLRGLVRDAVKGLRRGGGFRSDSSSPHEHIRDPPLLPHHLLLVGVCPPPKQTHTHHSAFHTESCVKDSLSVCLKHQHSIILIEHWPQWPGVITCILSLK